MSSCLCKKAEGAVSPLAPLVVAIEDGIDNPVDALDVDEADHGPGAAAKKALEKILRGTADANIFFDDLQRVLQSLGFNERIRQEVITFSPGRAWRRFSTCSPRPERH
jgi:hypothetical protein